MTKFKRITILLLIMSVLTTQVLANPIYSPDFSDELSRVGIRVEPDDADGIRLLEKTGVNTIRYALNWHHFEPTKGQWNTDYIDDRISLLRSYDINSMIGVGVNNPIYSGNSDIRFGVESRENLEAFSNYCLKLGEYLAENYPEIKEFLIWNEPNSSSFWKNDPNPAAYYTLVKTASIAFKQNIPDCTIIAGVTANPSILFLSQLYELGIYNYADVISSQPYVAPSNADEGTLAYRLQQYNNLTNQYGGWKEHYISEIGWHTYAGDNTSGVSEDVQAENLVKSLALADEYDMRGVNFYELVDSTGNSVKSENHYGLVKSDTTAKAGFDALVHFQDIIGGAEYAGKLISLDKKSFAYIYHKNGEIIALAWTQNTSASLSTLNMVEYIRATDIYGNELDSPSLSASPIYLILANGESLYSAISSSIRNYYNNIPDSLITDEIQSLIDSNLSIMDKNAVRNFFEQHYTAAYNLIDSTEVTLRMSSAFNLHMAATKLGILYNYLSPDQPSLSELKSDESIVYASDRLENPYSETTFTVNLSDVELGDTVTLLITDNNDIPVYFTQKTIGSEVAQELEFTLGTTTPGQYKGSISARVSKPSINSITASNPHVTVNFENKAFTITVNSSIDPELKNFDYEYPYAQAILHQAKQYNEKAHTLNDSAYESIYKPSYIEVADYISSRLSELSVKAAITEEASFDRGFSIVTTPSIIKHGGVTQISAEITNKNSTTFSGTAEIIDNDGCVLQIIDVTIPENSTETINFDLNVPERADKGQYFYYVNLVKSQTVLSSRAVYVNTQIGPYSNAEITDKNQVASTPAENKFKVGNTEYILLDTTMDNNSKFFVMEENISANSYFDYDHYDIDFDPSDRNNIAYYLNNAYKVNPAVKNYIDNNHLWLTEAGYGDSVCPTDYTVECGINLMSVQEWNKYAGKFGYAPSGVAANTWWLRTPGTNINTIRYISKPTGKCLHTFSDKESRGVRPVYFLNRNFFKEVPITSAGSNVIEIIKNIYSPNELLSCGVYTKADLISMGIASEDDFLLDSISLTDKYGKNISSPENLDEINLSITYNENTPFSAFLAVYTKSGELIGCTFKNIDGDTTMNLKLNQKAPQDSFAKLFIWESNTLTPLDTPVIFGSY